MSTSLTSYADVASAYGNKRVPLFSQEVHQVLSPQFNRFSRGADFGCGEGSYVQSLADFCRANGAPFGEVIMLDKFGEMLDTAKARLGEQVAASFRQVDLVKDELPVEAKSLDWALSTQSAHHWGRNQLETVLGKIHATLKDGAPLVIIFGTPDQVYQAQWEMGICSLQTERHPDSDPGHLYSQNFIPRELMLASLERVGFKVKETRLITQPYNTLEADGNPESVFDREVQAGGSFYQYARDRGMLEAYLALAREAIDDGRMAAHMERSAQRRLEIGVATMVVASA